MAEQKIALPDEQTIANHAWNPLGNFVVKRVLSGVMAPAIVLGLLSGCDDISQHDTSPGITATANQEKLSQMDVQETIEENVKEISNLTAQLLSDVIPGEKVKLTSIKDDPNPRASISNLSISEGYSKGTGATAQIVMYPDGKMELAASVYTAEETEGAQKDSSNGYAIKLMPYSAQAFWEIKSADLKNQTLSGQVDWKMLIALMARTKATPNETLNFTTVQVNDDKMQSASVWRRQEDSFSVEDVPNGIINYAEQGFSEAHKKGCVLANIVFKEIENPNHR